MSGSPLVELEQVTFAYEGAGEPSLVDVDLRLEARDFLGILGPNGGGKTTLLNVVLGFLKPQQGTVRVFGEVPARVRHRVGYVPQYAQIDATVPADALDVVLMGRLHRSSWGPRFRRRDVDAAMEALHQTRMDGHARRPIATLSGGQRQRVMIARAIAADVELLLLDEPTAGVDLHREREVLELLDRLNERMPIMMVSHDLSLVSSHLKRAACVNRGLRIYPAGEITSEIIEAMYHGAEG